MSKKGITRREFLAGAGAAGGMLVLGDGLASARVATAPSDRIRVALAGLGRQGRTLLDAFMQTPGVEVAAVCDVDEAALNRARAAVEAAGAKRRPHLFSDVRRALDDRHIDAVAIATPNHWHSLMGIWACQSGKDCYVESPCSHSFHEGWQLVAAAQKYERVVQYGGLGAVGGLSGFDPVAVACLGPVRSIRTVCFPSKTPADAPPPRFSTPGDHDLWLGPARASRAHRAQLNWRKLPSMHNNDLGFFALNDLHAGLRLLESTLPARVSTLSAGRYASVTRGACVAVRMEFDGRGGAAGRLDLEVLPRSAMSRETARLAAARQGSRPAEKGRPAGVVSETTVRGAGGSLTMVSVRDPAADAEYLVQNFVAAVRGRNRQMLASPIEHGHITCGSLHLANISLALKRPVNFDPETQSSPYDEQVEELLLGSHRAPYTLPSKI